MLKNYFKIAWRNLIRDRQFSLLNLIGLSTGLACALLIYLWVNDERSVDKFNEKDSQLFQIMKTAPNGDGTVSTFDVTQGMLAKSMASDIPEIEYAVSVRKEGEMGIATVADKHIKANWEFADKDFFNVFTYHLIQGNKNSVLSDKYGALISDKLAMKIFNTTENVIGKTITWDHGGEFNGSYNITGVFKSLPSTASDQSDILFSYTLFSEKEMGGMGDVSNWGSNMSQTFLILKKGTDIKQFNNKIKDYTKSKIKALTKSNDMLKWEGNIFAERYSDRYLYNRYDNGVQSGGRIEYVKLFSVIAIFILLIACINFMNLSTAKASRRIKEVGIRKVVGARRGTLILQYIGESMLMAFLSLMIAMVLVWILLPAFTEITGKNVTLNFNPGFIFSIFLITLITGIISGSYPALYLSGFRPAMVLKGKLNSSAGESWTRKGLVVFQFAISVMLIISVMVVYKQMALVQTKNLGYNKDNIIRFSSEGKLREGLATFLTEIKNIPGVVTASSVEGDLLGNPGHSGGGINWEGKDPNLGIEYYGIGVDYNFIEMLGLKMKDGRSFSKEFGSDSSKVIFNESAIAAMGLKNPVGKTVSLWGKKSQIIGIANDFHFESLYKKVAPFFFYYSPNNNNVLIKIKAGIERETLARIENFYKQFNQGLPFEYKFLDDDYQALYASEQRVAVLSRYFAGIAIIISCLGLFGLAAFTAQKRQKEIGIRKVVGASISNVVVMLSTDFLKLVLIAVLIAFPLAWWTMNKWLEGFAYRIHIGVSMFLIAGMATIFITLLTISFQSIKAAVANPVKSLRTE
jgi:putative ABC transport system permease protein